MNTAADNGNWRVSITAQALELNGQVLEGVYKENPTGIVGYQPTFTHSAGGGTHTVELPVASTVVARRTFNIFLAAGYALYRHGAGLDRERFMFYYDPDVLHYESAYDYSEYAVPTMKFDVWSYERKFQIAYVVGRHIAALAVGADMIERDVTGFSESCPASTGRYSIAGREYQAAAIQEGFAHFYSADVWNNHDQDDCTYKYFVDELGFGAPYGAVSNVRPTINCESSSAGFSNSLMESKCAQPWEGRGVPLDWMRTFWDLHTDTNISFNSIISWLRNADSWGEQTGYQELEEEAAQIGGTFYSTWRLAATGNGVDHPNE